MEPRFGVLTVPQVAKLLQMSDDRVYRLIRANQLPGAINIDGQYRIAAPVFYKWIDGRLSPEEVWHWPTYPGNTEP